MSKFAPTSEGLVTIKAELDRTSLKRTHRDALFPSRGVEKFRRVAQQEIAFVDSRSKSGGKKNPLVSTSLADKGDVRGSGGDRELARMVLRSGLHPIGVVVSPPESTIMGLAVEGKQLMRRGYFGPDSPVITPGVEVVGDVPVDIMPGTSHAGMVKDKPLMGLRAVDSRTPATALLEAINRLLASPEGYRAAMDNKFAGTNSWQSAAKLVTDSYLGSQLLAVGDLVDAGLLTPTPALAEKFGSISARSNEAASGATDGQKTTAALAQFMQLTKLPADTPVGLTDAEQADFATLRVRLGRMCFQPGDRSVAFGEFNKRPGKGFSKRGTDPVRNSPADLLRSPLATFSTGHIRKDTYGQILNIQLNLATAAFIGFNAAVLDERSRVMGRAVSGESPNGDVDVSLGSGA